MGFEWWASEQRVRINLSEKASIVIAEDMFQFEVKDRSAFMNTIFQQFYSHARASAALYLQNKKRELLDIFKKDISDKLELEHIVSILLKKEEEKLSHERRIVLRNKYIGQSYRINNENLQYLTSDECQEQLFYDHKVGSYLKCILEEYASLPYIERERIYYRDIVETVSRAIETHALLKIQTKENQQYYVSPYSLSTDTLSTRLYLTGYSVPISETGAEKQPASFRIPGIKSVRIMQKNGRITEKAEILLKHAINNRSVPFLTSTEQTIRVRLSDSGIQKYHSILSLRPVMDHNASTEHEYVFHCTEMQATYYFVRFGKDAEILEPLTLRDRLQKLHREAAEQYEK